MIVAVDGVLIEAWRDERSDPALPSGLVRWHAGEISGENSAANDLGARGVETASWILRESARKILLALAGALLLIPGVAGCATQAPSPKPPRQSYSTPRAVAVAFVRAEYDGKSSVMRALMCRRPSRSALSDLLPNGSGFQIRAGAVTIRHARWSVAVIARGSDGRSSARFEIPVRREANRFVVCP
jgi:hypothetical protein